MYRLFFSLLVTSMLISTSLPGQSEGAPDAFTFRYIGNNFQWPLDAVDDLDLGDFTSGIEFEYFRYLNNAFDLSVPLRIATVELPMNADGSRIRKEANAGLNVLLNYNIYKGKVFRPRLFTGVGALLLEMDEFSLDVPFGLGLNFYLGGNTSLSTTFAYHINDTEWRDHLQFGVGLRIALEEEGDRPPDNPDRDGDGITDTEDLCPDVAGTIALNGCPDRDGDGITDGSDKCPDEAGPADNDGCPVTDRDGDGLVDAEDDCPDEAGPADNDGCPVSDRDGDGVVDAEDDCPDEAGPADNDGCPEKSIVIVAQDKLTGEVLPNTEVALRNSSGQIVKTGTTNSLGIAEFNNVAAGDYTVEGKLYDVVLETARIGVGEFNTSEPVQKTVYYDDPNFIVQGRVFYCNTTNPLPGISVNLRNNADNFLKSTISDEDGQYIFHLAARATYELYAKKENFLSEVIEVDANDYNRSKSVFVRLEVCADEVECGDAVRLNNILYDLNSYAIRPDAEADLNRVVQFMRDNPTARVEISSHTDSRGRAGYNLTLSQGRAKSAVDYIVSKGIDSSRIDARGYGETQLLNECADGVSCTEAEHQLNRRTEFKVICPD